MKFLLLLAAGMVLAVTGVTGQGGDDLPPVKPIDYPALVSLLRSDSGATVLVNAWASWCKPCREEMPALVRIAARHTGDRFIIVMIAIDDPDSLDAVIRPMLASNGVTFPTYILQGSPDEQFIPAMNADWSGALPATFIYSPEGRQVSMLIGGKTEQQFEEALRPYLPGGADSTALQK